MGVAATLPFRPLLFSDFPKGNSPPVFLLFFAPAEGVLTPWTEVAGGFFEEVSGVNSLMTRFAGGQGGESLVGGWHS